MVQVKDHLWLYVWEFWLATRIRYTRCYLNSQVGGEKKHFLASCVCIFVAFFRCSFARCKYAVDVKTSIIFWASHLPEEMSFEVGGTMIYWLFTKSYSFELFLCNCIGQSCGFLDREVLNKCCRTGERFFVWHLRVIILLLCYGLS